VIRNEGFELGVVAYSCNPSTGGGNWENGGSRLAWVISQIPSQSTSWVWGYVPAIPAMQEAVGRRLTV
jgi:hypothetical protein